MASHPKAHDDTERTAEPAFGNFKIKIGRVKVKDGNHCNRRTVGSSRCLSWRTPKEVEVQLEVRGLVLSP
jgi:hypothetical protein